MTLLGKGNEGRGSNRLPALLTACLRASDVPFEPEVTAMPVSTVTFIPISEVAQRLGVSEPVHVGRRVMVRDDHFDQYLVENEVA
jgi:hypothetical protein